MVVPPHVLLVPGGANGNNKYYSNSIPANIFNPGDVVQYYFKIPYSDHLPTSCTGTYMFKRAIKPPVLRRRVCARGHGPPRPTSACLAFASQALHARMVGDGAMQAQELRAVIEHGRGERGPASPRSASAPACIKAQVPIAIITTSKRATTPISIHNG